MANSDGASRLEVGEIVAPAGAFTPSEAEMARVANGAGSGLAKNVSLDPNTGVLRGASADASNDGRIAALMRRHAQWARERIIEAAPAYNPHLRMGRASLRTRDASAAALSLRKDDRRLHADAFPSRPTGGERILRVFSNINPAGHARIWRVGEPFEDYARRWLGRLRWPWPGEAWLLQRVGVTRGARTAYDSLMLHLHDRAKLDETYQRWGPSREIAFSAGSSWMVFTDSVVHAAMSGCFALEQTFYLPIVGMENPDRSPLRVLERLTGRTLA